MPMTGWIEVNENHCKGCSVCVSACPQDVMSLNMDRLTPKGYHPVFLHAEGCTGCAICAVVCPDAALTIYREKQPKAEKAAVATA